LTSDAANPLLLPWTAPFGAPPFGDVRAEDFMPAFRAAIAENEIELRAIASNPAAADFDNTLAALERAGEVLGRVRRLFWTLASAQSDDAIRAIEGEVSALLTAHGTRFSQDAALFARVSAVHARGEDLAVDQRRLVETVYDGFVAGGAALDASGKARLAAIDQSLSQLSVTFGHNVMSATNAWTMILDEADLDGLPDGVRAAAAANAARAGHEGRYLFTLDRTDYEAFLGFSTRRDLRERLWRAFVARCEGGPHDNVPVIAELLTLRNERAILLGYPDYPAFKLEDSMAATADTAEALLLRVWEPAKRKAAEEAAELQKMIDDDAARENRARFELGAWDWRFYAERIRLTRFALDGNALRAYLRLDAVRAAAFDAAERLYGLRFVLRIDLPGYHPQVQAWEVVRENGAFAGLLYTDYLTRPEKHGGAWMGSLRVQEKLDGDVRPIAYVVANFAGAAEPGETRLSLDEARTLFHEFGHALHALLSDVTYPSQAGTAVARDFVEFPSKFMEHWIVAPEVLGAMGVPAELISAIVNAESYGQGYATVELVSSALIDLAVHRDATAAAADPIGFTAAALERLDAPSVIGMRHRLPYFTHIFDGGYASAYYSYLWSEVLDTDAYDAFAEAGDIFDQATANRFRDEILAQGNKRDPMESFIAFRGREPAEDALVEHRGLV